MIINIFLIYRFFLPTRVEAEDGAEARRYADVCIVRCVSADAGVERKKRDGWRRGVDAGLR